MCRCQDWCRYLVINSKRGFTIIELLVVASIFGAIIAITSLLFFKGRDAVEQSSEKIDTAGRSRRALDNLTPIVSSAIKVGGTEALVVLDTTPDDLTDTCRLDVTTREDFLTSDYTPTTDFDAFGPYYRFRILYEPADETVKLYKLSLVTGDIETAVPARLMARDVAGCGFEPVTVGSVRMTLQIKADRPNERRPGGVTTTTIRAILAAPGSR